MTRAERIETNAIVNMEDVYGIKDRSFSMIDLSMDDQQNREASAICRWYAEQWNKLADKGIGILLYGDVGTGKTFLAKAVAREIARKDTLTAFFSTARFLTVMQSTQNKIGVIDYIAKNELIVLDDIGAERETSFADEQLFFLLETIAGNGRTLIATSNLDPERMREVEDKTQRRMFDRVLDLCPLVIPLTGESRRKVLTEKKAKKAMEIICGKR